MLQELAMKIEYVNPIVDQHESIKSRINRNTPTWLSRNKGEVCVIIPGRDFKSHDKFSWIWIASKNGDGAYISATEQTLDEIANTIFSGDWKFQPNLTITLEDNN
jgi:hypothetical protein